MMIHFHPGEKINPNWTPTFGIFLRSSLRLSPQNDSAILHGYPKCHSLQREPPGRLETSVIHSQRLVIIQHQIEFPVPWPQTKNNSIIDG